MQITLLSEPYFYPAIYGTRLSYAGSIQKMDTFHESKYLGSKDLHLLSKLVLAGNEHAKTMRMVNITLLVKASLKFWVQFDTYKVGTVSASSSQMHSLMKQELSQASFKDGIEPRYLEYLIYLQRTKDFDSLVYGIPQSYLYDRVIQVNYQTLRTMYFQRRNHRLGEWAEFLSYARQLPYAEELITIES